MLPRPATILTSCSSQLTGPPGMEGITGSMLGVQNWMDSHPPSMGFPEPLNTRPSMSCETGVRSTCAQVSGLRAHAHALRTCICFDVCTAQRWDPQLPLLSLPHGSLPAPSVHGKRVAPARAGVEGSGLGYLLVTTLQIRGRRFHLAVVAIAQLEPSCAKPGPWSYAAR